MARENHLFFAHKLVMLSNNKIFSYLQIDKIV